MLRGGFLEEEEKRKQDLLWQLFEDTGDPMCWLMYRRGDAGREE